VVFRTSLLLCLLGSRSALNTIEPVARSSAEVYYQTIFLMINNTNDFFFLQQSLNLLSRLLAHRTDLHPKANTFFLENDILRIKSLRGITHVYCFDCGFPETTIEHIVRLFNHWYAIISKQLRLT
jgi:hypothetical protein